MATMHKVIAAFDDGWVADAPMAQLDILIPAGATLKRYLVHAQTVSGTTNGIGVAAAGRFSYGMTVSFTSGQYVGDVIFRKQWAIPTQTVALYDVLSNARVYTQYLNGGDETFFVDQRCSYGLRSGPAFNLRLDTRSYVALGWTGLLSNARYSVIFTAIYETVP